MVKTTINTLACALIATLALAQTDTTTAKQTTTGSGTVTTFEPGEIIVVGSERGQDTFSYALDDAVRYVNKAGKQIDERLIKPGSRVHVYYDNTGETPVVNRVVVDEVKAKITRKLKSAGS
jgi:ABC-type Fe3+-hydroxamate transport system substrate-binding protein